MAGVVVESDDEGVEQSDYNMTGDGDGGEGGKRGISKEVSKLKGCFLNSDVSVGIIGLLL